jgi:hypothetical protein
VLPPILLLAGGVASLIYGTLYHTAIVYEEKEVEEKIPIPTPFGPPGALDQDPWDDEPNPSESGSDGPSALDVSPDARAGEIVESINPFEGSSAGGAKSADENPFEKRNGESSEEFNPFESSSSRKGTSPTDMPATSSEDAPAREADNPFENRSETGQDPFQASPAEGPILSEPDPDAGEAPWDGPPAGGLPPFALPEPMFQTVTRVDLVPRDEPEWVIVREVTYGGITRLENGQLKRTYSGQPPALCPT